MLEASNPLATESSSLNARGIGMATFVSCSRRHPILSASVSTLSFTVDFTPNVSADRRFPAPTPSSEHLTFSPVLSAHIPLSADNNFSSERIIQLASSKHSCGLILRCTTESTTRYSVARTIIFRRWPPSCQASHVPSRASFHSRSRTPSARSRSRRRKLCQCAHARCSTHLLIQCLQFNRPK